MTRVGLLGSCVVALLLLCGVVVGTPPVHGADKKEPDKSTRDPDKKDDLKGRARWDWKLYNDKGKEIGSNTFMGYVTGEVKHGQNQVGSWKSTGPTAMTVTFTEGELKGTADIRQTKPNPVTYEGTLTRKNMKLKLVVIIKND